MYWFSYLSPFYDRGNVTLYLFISVEVSNKKPLAEHMKWVYALDNSAGSFHAFQYFFFQPPPQKKTHIIFFVLFILSTFFRKKKYRSNYFCSGLIVLAICWISYVTECTTPLSFQLVDEFIKKGWRLKKKSSSQRSLSYL